MSITSHQIPETGFLRIWHIVGNPKANPPIPALIPIGRTTFLNGVKDGIYPAPVRLGGPKARTVAWKVEDIRALIASMGGEA
jgi:prophage regulatory protein